MSCLYRFSYGSVRSFGTSVVFRVIGLRAYPSYSIFLEEVSQGSIDQLASPIATEFAWVVASLVMFVIDDELDHIDGVTLGT